MAPNPNDISLRQLEYVVAVADTLGFSKAAARCRVSQPTLSAQVQQLESVLGVVIFERGKHRVMVTAAGNEIVARARQVLANTRDLIGAATRARAPFGGALGIGVIPTIAPYLLPEVVPALMAGYPGLSLAFREEKTAEIARDLAEGALDAGLLALEADVGGCAHAVIVRDVFVAALPKGHPLTRKARVSLSDLDTTQVLLLDEGHCFREQVLQLCEKAAPREANLRATSLATLAQMVSVGGGITLLPSMAVAVENRRAQLEIRALEEPSPARTIALVWRSQSPFEVTFRQLASAIRDSLARTTG
jgi:LysR family hydrogen peroxide-inducible transcriptional activator